MSEIVNGEMYSSDGGPSPTVTSISRASRPNPLLKTISDLQDCVVCCRYRIFVHADSFNLQLPTLFGGVGDTSIDRPIGVLFLRPSADPRTWARKRGKRVIVAGGIKVV